MAAASSSRRSQHHHHHHLPPHHPAPTPVSPPRSPSLSPAGASPQQRPSLAGLEGEAPASSGREGAAAERPFLPESVGDGAGPPPPPGSGASSAANSSSSSSGSPSSSSSSAASSPAAAESPDPPPPPLQPPPPPAGSGAFRELLEACRNGDVTRVRRLVDAANVNAKDMAGRKSTPLHFAAGKRPGRGPGLVLEDGPVASAGRPTAWAEPLGLFLSFPLS